MKKPSKKEKDLGRKLNPKQKAFALAYLEHGNGTRAAKEAGYSEKAAHSQSTHLLRNSKVIEYMDAVRERLESDKIADIEEVMQYLTRVMRGEEHEQFDFEVSIADKTNAAKELAKRLESRQGSGTPAVTIINNIPRPEKGGAYG